ncbi:MAG TPA: hypothetical protein VMW79_05995 [Anaerolineae bacterium]|nr:hypothetical protein [Anaerolineae bacterium]HUW96016.1 hypothetical protein [Anaerolineae bacterium]
MREPMTRERMIEILQVTAEDLGHRGRNTLLEWSIRNIEAVRAALEAESPCAYAEPIRIVRLDFDRHIEGHFFFNDYICLPKDAAPDGVNSLTTLAYIVEEGPHEPTNLS